MYSVESRNLEHATQTCKLQVASCKLREQTELIPFCPSAELSAEISSLRH